MKIKKIKIKVANQDQPTEMIDIGADAQNIDYNDTTIKAELDKINTTLDNYYDKDNINNLFLRKTDFEEENERLREDIAGIGITKTETGESIDITDCAKARFVKFETDGNSKQAQYSGKNLAEINSNYWDLTEDNAIQNKAQNAGADLTTFNVKSGQTVKINLKLISKPSSSTTFSAYKDETSFLDISFTEIQMAPLNQIITRTFTATEDTEINYKMWGNDNSDTFKFQFWAELDNVTDYEPYTGEQSSPNPPYPQKVKSCGDNVNLFDISKRIYTQVAPQTVSVTLLNKTLNANIDSGLAHSAYLIDNLTIGEKYTISWKNANNLNSVQLARYINSTQGDQIFRSYKTTDTITFVAPIKQVQLNILASSSSLSITELKLEQRYSSNTI